MKNTTKTLLTIGAVAGFSFTAAQAATVFTGGTGSDFDSAWDNGLVSSTNPGTVDTSASGLVRATANFGGGWTIDHTAGDLDFSGGGWNVNGGVGSVATTSYNLSGGSIDVNGTGTQDRGNFLVNKITFNLSGGAVSSELTFGLANGGAMNFLAGSGTLDSAAFKTTSVGTMNFFSGWTGFATVDSLDVSDWETLLATTLVGSTFDGVDITTGNFADNFVVNGNTLTLFVPEPSSTALLGLGLSSLLMRRKRSAA